MALPSDSPRPFWKRTSVRIVAGVVLVLLLLGIRFLWVYREHKDEIVLVNYVYDQMLPGAVMEIGRRCLLPERKVEGTLRVVTENGAIRFTKLTPTKIPVAWSEGNRTCVFEGFERFQRTPTDFVVPDGREYELDVDFQFPPAQTQE